MTAKTIFPDAQGMVYLRCPFCNTNTSKSAKLFPIHELIRIGCPCGNSYEVIIEFRKAFRKKASLSGIFWKIDSPDVFKNVTIADITLEGCCLLASDNHGLNQGEYIRLVFRLDNPERTKIDRKAEVRWIDRNYIGCQFVDKPTFNPELGFYVQDFKVPK